MKQYQSIKKYDLNHLGQHILAFNKLDGSNFRVEWSRKISKQNNSTKGFIKFGTRNRVITNANDQFYKMTEIFEDKYADKVDEIFRKHKIYQDTDKITLYGEFYGPNSFGGFHDWNEEHDLYFFDAFKYKRNFLSPSEFYSEFRDISMPKLIFKGKFEYGLIRDIQFNRYSLKEGAVYKFINDGKVTCGKIKTFEWLEKVRDLYGEEKMLEY